MVEETKLRQADLSQQTTSMPLTFTPDLYSKLSILAVNRRATRKELQGRLGTSKSQMTKVVGELKHLGLIKRCSVSPEDLHVLSIELTPAGEAVLRAPAPIGRIEVTPDFRGVLEILKAGEQDQLTPEQLALPLKPAEVEEVVSLLTGNPFRRHNLYYNRKRGELEPLAKRDKGYSYRYTLAKVLDFIERKQHKQSSDFKKPVISPDVREVLEVLKAKGEERLTQEQLALSLARAEVREVLTCSMGKPFLQTRLADLIRRAILTPVDSRKRGTGNRLHYSLKGVLDLIEKLNAPKNEIAFELVEVLEVLRTPGRDHLTQKHLDLPLTSAEVVVLATHVLGKPFPQQRIKDLCRRKHNRLQPIGPRRGSGHRSVYRVGDVLKALENPR